MKSKRAAQIAFATGMIGLGVVGFVFGDFAQLWRSAPKWVPGRQALDYASAALVLACGVGLLSRRTQGPASRALLYFWALAVLLIEVPVVVRHPLNEIAWQGLAHVTMLLTAAWMLFTTNERAVRIARLLFGLTLIPIGLAHFVYLELTAPLVPTWLPYHTFWAYFTGAAQIAAAAGVLLGIYARLAAGLEAVLLALFTFLVWPPLMFAAPTKAGLWSEFTISWAMTAAAWVVAVCIRAPERGIIALSASEGEPRRAPAR
ncbi:MAG TPA: DoxX family membrane protein [Gemmatimonadaceae bacterium]|nr:DoxX family membrane protein [Gemmatimonadaceae bacterium]